MRFSTFPMASLITQFRAQIEHLQGRGKALEPLGRTGRKADWIALACLDGGGIFTREQPAHHLQMSRWQVLRVVQALVRKGFTSENNFENWNVCRIFNRQIFRALGGKDIGTGNPSASNLGP